MNRKTIHCALKHLVSATLLKHIIQEKKSIYSQAEINAARDLENEIKAFYADYKIRPETKEENDLFFAVAEYFLDFRDYLKSYKNEKNILNEEAQGEDDEHEATQE